MSSPSLLKMMAGLPPGPSAGCAVIGSLSRVRSHVAAGHKSGVRFVEAHGQCDVMLVRIAAHSRECTVTSALCDSR